MRAATLANTTYNQRGQATHANALVVAMSVSKYTKLFLKQNYLKQKSKKNNIFI